MTKRTFSDFIRNAEGDERREVFERVIDDAIQRQRNSLGCYCDDTLGESCAVCHPLGDGATPSQGSEVNTKGTAP